MTAMNWDDVWSSDNSEYGCNIFTSKINSARERFTVRVKKIQEQRQSTLVYWKSVKADEE